MRRLLFPIFICCLSFGASARPGDAWEFSPANRFRNAAIELLEIIEASGADDVGRSFADLHGTPKPPRLVGVDEVIRQIPTIDVVEVDEIRRSAGEFRFSAFYDVSTRRVFINRLAPIPKEIYAVLALHECLGALGYDDINYQLSMAVHLLKQVSATGTMDRMRLEPVVRKKWARLVRMAPEKMKQAEFVGGGGGNGVGGGGDGEAILYKKKLLEALLPTLSSRSLKFANIFLDLNVEIARDPAFREVMIRRGPDFESVSVVLPYRLARAVIEGGNIKDTPAFKDILRLFSSVLEEGL